MIRNMSLNELSSVVEGQAYGDACFESICTDSRHQCQKALFVALEGPHYDGHHYVQEALDKQANAVMVSKPVSKTINHLQVADTTKALGCIGAFNRSLYQGDVIAITGSSGKTTCKELLKHILSLKGSVYATVANNNNEIGVAMSLLALKQSDSSAIVELGARGAGHIALLGSWVRPQIAIILNAQAAHLEGFVDIDGVAKGKGELLAEIRPGGCAILNRDSPYFDYWLSLLKDDIKILSFGFHDDADIFAFQKNKLWYLRTPTEEQSITLRLPGKHNIQNAAAAAAAAVALDIDLNTIVTGIADMYSVAGRLQRVRDHNPKLLDDSYNANPDSVRAAIDVLASYSGKRVLILGDMADLGAQTIQQHRDIGLYAKRCGIESLWCCGEATQYCAAEFGSNACYYADCDDLINDLTAAINADVILVKGSHIANMHRVVQHIMLWT